MPLLAPVQPEVTLTASTVGLHPRFGHTLVPNLFTIPLEDDLAALLEQLRQDGSDLELLGFGDRELQQLLDRLDSEDGLANPDDMTWP